MIRDKLFSMADGEYQRFASSLIPQSEPILGVRLPRLRALAKEIAKSEWKEFLLNPPSEYFEENMLTGMVIGYIKTNIDERLGYIERYIPHINNWSVCDSFCSSLKFTKTHKEEMFTFIMRNINSDNEFAVRFAVVMLLNYYIDNEYINRVISCIDRVSHEGYYVKIARAWALSVCYVNYPDLTMVYLKSNSLDDFTHNKTISKIIESHRISKDEKVRVRGIKRSVIK